MRILLISGSLPPMKCGIGDYTARLATALAKRLELEVAVLTDVGAVRRESDKDFTVFPVAHDWNMSDMFRIIKVVRGWNPDVVHIQYPTQGYGTKLLPYLLPSVLFSLKLPIVQTWHEYHPNGSRRHIPNAMLPGGLVVVRPHYMSMMPAWYRWLLRHKLFRFIPNAATIPAVSLSEPERLAIRLRFAPVTYKIIAYFGFVYPVKGLEVLFDVADPGQHHLVIISELNSADAYHKLILERFQHGAWAERTSVTGFLPAEEVAHVLAAVDAAVFPFRDGGGMWNTSLQAAAMQGTFVLVTSRERHGYDSSQNIYNARPGDISDMRQALNVYMGRRIPYYAVRPYADWDMVAEQHIQLYSQLMR